MMYQSGSVCGEGQSHDLLISESIKIYYLRAVWHCCWCTVKMLRLSVLLIKAPLAKALALHDGDVLFVRCRLWNLWSHLLCGSHLAV